MTKTTISIELDLGPGFERDEDGDFHPVDREAFDQQILDRVADRYVKHLTWSDGAKLEKLVSKRVDDVIDARLNDMIDTAVRGPLQRRDFSGNPVGDVFTINELIVAAVNKFATAPANRDSYNKTAGNLNDIVVKAVDDALRSDLAADVKEIKAGLVAQIKERLTHVLAAAVTK